MGWVRSRTPIIAALAAMFVFVWAASFAGHLVDWIEYEIRRGGSIDFSLRVYFAYATGLALLLLAYAVVLTGSGDWRIRFILAALGVECLVLLAIWLFDRTVFTDEESAIRFVTALMLIGSAAVALLNIKAGELSDGRHGLAVVFWSLLATAFFAGGIDEYFAVHEWVGRTLAPITEQADLPRQLFQDGITVFYAVGAILFVVVLRTPFRREMLQQGQVGGWILISGIILFGLAVANDTLDFVAEKLFPLASPRYAMNFLEEVLELTAAVMFFCACSISFCERRPEVFRSSVQESTPSTTQKRIAMLNFAPIFLTGLLLPVVLRFTLPAEPYSYSSHESFTVTVWADATSGLDSVDELLYVPDLGLLAGNEGSGEVLIFDDSGHSRPFITGLVSPDGLAYSGNSLYLTDDIAGEVRAYSTTGELLSISTNWTSPEGVAIDNSGNVYVADSAMGLVAQLVHGIAVPVATQLDGLLSPEQLATDHAGNLYIADERAKAVFVRSPDATIRRFVDGTDGIGTPETLLIHEGYLYVVDSAYSVIHRFDLDGNGGKFLSFTKKYDLSGIAFDSAGNMYIAITNELRSKNVILRLTTGDRPTSKRQ